MLSFCFSAFQNVYLYGCFISGFSISIPEWSLPPYPIILSSSVFSRILFLQSISLIFNLSFLLLCVCKWKETLRTFLPLLQWLSPLLPFSATLSRQLAVLWLLSLWHSSYIFHAWIKEWSHVHLIHLMPATHSLLSVLWTCQAHSHRACGLLVSLSWPAPLIIPAYTHTLTHTYRYPAHIDTQAHMFLGDHQWSLFQIKCIFIYLFFKLKQKIF